MNMYCDPLPIGLTAVNAFVITPASHGRHCQVASVSQQQQSRLILSSSSSSDGDSSNLEKRRLSRLEGNNRPASPDELRIMDEMIDKLADAKPYDLPNAVQRAFRVISSPQFFMRIAARADETTDETQQEKLAALAANLVSTLEAVVSTTEDRMDERAKDVENVIKAAAEPDSGEFMVPLLPERVQRCDRLCKPWTTTLIRSFSIRLMRMMKSHEDGMDLMVEFERRCKCTGTSIAGAKLANKSKESSSAAYKLFEQLLNTDADVWDAAFTQ
jgi:hypothetical protein